MKRTALYSSHVALGARMVPFGGFEMPIQYSGILQEHQAVRTAAGLLDLSHMGEFKIAGSGAADFLNRMTTNDVRSLSPGKAHYTALCREDGGILDDCVLYRLSEEFLLVINASNRDKDLKWLMSHCPEGVSVTDDSDATALLAIQGPRSRAILAELAENRSVLDRLPFYHYDTLRLCGMTLLCSRTGYTGELGYELYLPTEAAPALWDVLLERGRSEGLRPVGLAARDLLRLEMKYCLYGNDIDETVTPIEAGLGWITKIEKGPFVGSEAIRRVLAEGPARKLVAFEMADRGIPRKGQAILAGGKPLGIVTSGTHSPTLNRGIGMGYIDAAQSAVGTAVEIVVREKRLGAILVRPPFVKKSSLLD